MKGKNSLEVEQIDSTDEKILGVPLYTLDGNKLRILDNVYELTPELHKTLSSRAYTGKTTKKHSDTLLMNIIKNDLSYIGDRDKSSKSKKVLLLEFP